MTPGKPPHDDFHRSWYQMSGISHFREPSPLQCAIGRFASAGLVVMAADIAGLWIVPGYPELTSAQLIDAAGKLPYPL